MIYSVTFNYISYSLLGSSWKIKVGELHLQVRSLILYLLIEAFHILRNLEKYPIRIYPQSTFDLFVSPFFENVFFFVGIFSLFVMFWSDWCFSYLWMITVGSPLTNSAFLRLSPIFLKSKEVGFSVKINSFSSLF